ncbi:hypothetical protein WN943_005608 [Citrus x changshan-huyou]
MAVIVIITAVVLVAILLIRFIFEQEQDSEAHHHHTQGLDFSDNNVGQYSNYPPATQFEYSEKDNMFENGNIKGSHGYTSISTGTTDDANYQYNNMVVITEEEFINLEDGRRLCRNCYSISMKDAEDCKLLFHLVRKFFGLFDLKLDERPILLTDEYEIMRLRRLKERANGVFAGKESWVGITTTRIESWSLEGGEIKKITVPQKKTNKEAWVLLTFGYPK